jgi:hypothetical protein
MKFNTSLGLTGIPGYGYQLQRSANLATWTNLASFVPSANPATTYSDSDAPPEAAFYRLRIE